MLKKLIFILPVLAVAAYFIVPGLMKPSDNMMGMMGGPMPAVVADVIEQDITLRDEFSGRLTAVDNVQIRPRVAGQVESVHFEDGQDVKEGDLLFVIDPKPYRAALSAAQARFELAESEFKRAEPLLAEQAISQRDFESRKSNLASARAELTQARLNLGYTQVKAPISGKVGRREVTPGNLVNIGEPILTTVVSQHPIYADFEADEQRFLNYLAHKKSTEGEDVSPVTLEVTSANIPPREGVIHSFDNQLDVRSGTIRVRAVFDNQDGVLVPGMFARILMTSGESGPALLVADSAVGTDQDKKFVYIVDGKNKIQYREVTIGPAHDRLRVIRSGLSKGETIIAKGIIRLRPGMAVVPQKIGMEEAVSAATPAANEPTGEQPQPPETPAEPEA